jgi:predicted flap endonuclease-1-like 5' DNA nuclease
MKLIARLLSKLRPASGRESTADSRDGDAEPDASSEAAVKGTGDADEAEAATAETTESNAEIPAETAEPSNAPEAPSEATEEPSDAPAEPSDATAEPPDATAGSAQPTAGAGTDAETEPEIEAETGTSEAAEPVSEREPVEEDVEGLGAVEETPTEEAPDAEAETGIDEESEPAETPDPAAASETDEDGDAPVDSVIGIGPAYAQRLADAGVETVGDLVAADVAEVSEIADISESRIERWQERAREA